MRFLSCVKLLSKDRWKRGLGHYFRPQPWRRPWGGLRRYWPRTRPSLIPGERPTDCHPRCRGRWPNLPVRGERLSWRHRLTGRKRPTRTILPTRGKRSPWSILSTGGKWPSWTYGLLAGWEGPALVWRERPSRLIRGERSPCIAMYSIVHLQLCNYTTI